VKSTVLVFLGVAMGMSLAYAEPIEAPELEPSVNGAVSATELFPSQEYAAAFRDGTHYACNQSERATRRYANMLQARCVAVDMRAGMDWEEMRRHCFTASRRSAFVRQAEETCAVLSAYPGFLLARDGQADRSGACIPPKRCPQQ